MADQGAEHWLIAGQSAGAAAGRLDQGVEVWWRVVRERIAFRVAPDELDRIEFGGIRRQQLDSHAGMGDEPALDDFRAVGIAAILDDSERRPDQSRQVPEKGANAEGIDARLGGQAKTALHAVAAGRNHQGRNDGDLLARPPALIQHGRLAARRPRATHERGDQDARLVNEDQRGAAARGVFFTTGHRAFTHWAIAASSRSMARRAGCGGLHPNACSTRPI